MTAARLSPEERAAKVEALSEELATAVQALADSDAWRRMMEFATIFPRYSFRNQLVLWLQAEQRGVTISRVAAFGVWKKLGYKIVKGSKSFKIFAPVKTRLRPDEISKWLSEGKNPFGPDERPRMVLRAFKVESVFDVAQVEAGPDARSLEDGRTWVSQTGAGDAEVWQLITDGIEAAGFTFEHRPAEAGDGGAHGWTDYTNRVVWIDSSGERAEQIRIGAHELWGHIRAEHETRRDTITTAQRETEADSIAYLVLKMLGQDISSSTIEYVANWSGGDYEVLSAAMDTVTSVATAILEEIDSRLSTSPIYGDS